MTQQFTLDTSGAVYGQSPQWGGTCIFWSDLSPFAQGYVEAMLIESARGWTDTGKLVVSFSELHPEALDMILRDCEVLARRVGYMAKADAEMGALVWAQRQDGKISAFPPLRVYLDDGGKVRLEVRQ